jgi:rhamnose transport system ATP-binding protein
LAGLLLQVANLSKSYGGVHALRRVNLELGPGEIHALCGENGAGKSTLIKCLSGVVVPDAGSVLIDGRPLPFGSVPASEAAGIAVLHQESTVFRDLNAVDNLFVGREPTKARGILLDRRRMREEAADVYGRLGQTLDMRSPVGKLSFATRQTVAMARALSHRCRILVMDEPTASLSARETDTLLTLVRRLRDDGVTILYVSHRLEEIFRIADRVTVLRDGQHVATRDAHNTTAPVLIRLMVGREVEELTTRHEHADGIGKARLSVKNLSRGVDFRDVSLTVRAGEIVGLAGLVGAGRSELARAIFGIDSYDAGEVRLEGKPLPRGNVAAAVSRGLALVPEDRQHEGLLLPMSVAENLSLAILHRLTRGGLVSRRAERRLAEQLMDKLQIKAAGLDAPAETLSGGNQQKLVLGKWLAAEPRVLILDEPTRGVDVGAKAQVHQLIRHLAAGGMATLVISSELPELLSICDRTLVMREGRLSGELDGKSATQEKILELALPDATKASRA